MTNEQVNQLRSLDGHHVSLALQSGSRIDDSPFVPAGLHRMETVGPLGQLISMTEWALPPAVPGGGRDAPASGGPAKSSPIASAA